MEKSEAMRLIYLGKCGGCEFGLQEISNLTRTTTWRAFGKFFQVLFVPFNGSQVGVQGLMQVANLGFKWGVPLRDQLGQLS